MPAQTDISRRSTEQHGNSRTTRSSRTGSDQYYLRRMKEILQSTTTSSLSKSISVSGLPHTFQNNGTAPLVGPPPLPVRLLDHVYMGSQRNADDVQLLKQLRITHVLNCAGLRRFEFTRSPYPKEAGIKGFLMISAEDHEDFDIKSHFVDAIAFLDDVKRQRGRALVHCNLGVNRSGAVAAAYLMTSQQRYLLEVIEYLKIKRHVVLTNKGFRRQLIRFARERGLLDPVDDDVIDGELRDNTPSKSSGTTSTPSQHDDVITAGGRSPDDRHQPVPIVVVVNDVSDSNDGKPDVFSGRRSQKNEKSAASAPSHLQPDSLPTSNLATNASVDASSMSYRSSNAAGNSTNFLFPGFESSRISSSSSAAATAVSEVDGVPPEVSPDAASITSTKSSSVLGGFLSLFGSAAATPARRSAGPFSKVPLRSTSFSNVSSCTGGSTSSISGSPITAFSNGGSVQLPSGAGAVGSSSAEPVTLSTSRPLRVYTRSSTDTELYRPGGGRGGRPTSASRPHFAGRGPSLPE